jgi:uncharacterized protein YggE
MNISISVCRSIFLCVLCLSVVSVGSVRAETPSKPGTVRATGQHELRLKPQKLRLSITIQAQGKDAKSAIESFLAHKERVKKELIAMKADEKSIEFGATQVTGVAGGMPAEMQQYGAGAYIAQVARAVPSIKASDIPKIYHAVAHVRAEWPLPTSDADALALLPETLKEQAKARDLMGEKNKAKLDGRQQEKLEEVQAAMQENVGYSTSGDENPTFSVMFVAKVDDEARKNALKAAYEQAAAQAATLASAAGYKTGELVTIKSSDVPSIVPGENAYAAAFSAYTANTLENNVTDEVQSLTASELKFSTRVEVEFALAK